MDGTCLWLTLFRSFWHFNVWYTCSYASPSDDKTLIFVIFSSVLTNCIITRGAAHGWSKKPSFTIWVTISFACISCRTCLSSLYGFNGQLLLTSRWESFEALHQHLMYTICFHKLQALFLVLYLVSTTLNTVKSYSNGACRHWFWFHVKFGT
jgi:hypothetical protein